MKWCRRLWHCVNTIMLHPLASRLRVDPGTMPRNRPATPPVLEVDGVSRRGLSRTSTHAHAHAQKNAYLATKARRLKMPLGPGVLPCTCDLRVSNGQMSHHEIVEQRPPFRKGPAQAWSALYALRSHSSAGEGAACVPT
jgi:hypothetical protein